MGFLKPVVYIEPLFMYDAYVALLPLIKRLGLPKLGINGGLLLITLSLYLLWLSPSVVELRIYV